MTKIAFALAIILVAGCSDDDIGIGTFICEEGVEADEGLGCCTGGCGSSTDGWLPRICQNGKWECEYGTLEDACASKINACTVKTACAQTVGIGKEEPDPAPELCCTGSSASRRRRFAIGWSTCWR